MGQPCTCKMTLRIPSDLGRGVQRAEGLIYITGSNPEGRNSLTLLLPVGDI